MKLDNEPRLQGVGPTLMDWARKVAQALNPVIDWWGTWANIYPAGPSNTAGTILNVDGSGVQGYAALILNKTAAAGAFNTVDGRRVGLQRWRMQLGNTTAESGSNAGSDFSLSRYNDAGTLIDAPLTFNRANGQATFTQQVNVNAQGVLINGASALVTLNKSTGGSSNWSYVQGTTNGVLRWQMFLGNNTAEGGGSTGSNFALWSFDDSGTAIGQPMAVARASCQSTFQAVGNAGYVSTFVCSGAQGAGIRFSGAAGDKTLRTSPTTNDLEVVNHAYNAVLSRLTDVGSLYMLKGYHCQAGQNAGIQSNVFNYFWSGSAILAYIDSSFIGTIQMVSDERIKHSLQPIVSDRDAFMAVKPVRYRFKTAGIYVDDGLERWGFSAQNLTATIPAAVVGDVQAINEDGTPKLATVDDRPILAVTVLEVQALIREVAALRAEIETLKGATNG